MEFVTSRARISFTSVRLTWLRRVVVWRCYPRQTTTKRPIILGHGLGGSVPLYYMLIDHYLAQGYPVLALEQPGHGVSSPACHFRDAAAMVADTVIALSPDDAPVLVGHSLGGLLFLKVSMDLDVERLVIVNSPVGVSEMGLLEITHKLGRIGADVTQGLARGVRQAMRQGQLSTMAVGLARMVLPPPSMIPVAATLLRGAIPVLDGGLDRLAERGICHYALWSERDVVQPVVTRSGRDVMMDRATHCSIIEPHAVSIIGRYTTAQCHLLAASA